MIELDTGRISDPFVVDEDVASYRFGNDSDLVFYFKDVKNDIVGDVYQTGELIATDVLLSSIYNYPKSSAIAYFVDYNDRNQDASLYFFLNGIKTKIADEVYSFVADDSYHIAYIVDNRADRQRGDAFLYNNSDEPTRIDTDVSAWVLNRHNIDNSPIISIYSQSPAVLGNSMDSIVGTWYNDDITVFNIRTDGVIVITGYSSFVNEFSYRYMIDGNKVFLSSADGYIESTYSLYENTLNINIEGGRVLVLTRNSPNSEAFENATAIALNSPISVNITSSDQMRYYAFTPSSSGSYSFYSSDSGDCDPIGWLLDYEYYPLIMDDDSEGGGNFRVTYQLTAGDTYYIRAGCYGGNTGSYTLTARME